MAFVHSLTAGNDLGIWWVALVVGGSAAAVATAVLARLLQSIRHATPPSPPLDAADPFALRNRALR